MPSLGSFLRSGKHKKSTPQATTGTTSSSGMTSTLSDKRQSSPLPRIELQRIHSMASIVSLNIFKKKDVKPDPLEDPNHAQSRSTVHSQSVSAVNGLAELRINTPNLDIPLDFMEKSPTVPPKDTKPTHRRSSSARTRSPVSPISSFSMQTSLPLPPTAETKPSFLSLTTTDSSSDPFNLNIDFAKFEHVVKEEPPSSVSSTQQPKRITNHDFLFL